jgi:hypothetical protein
MELIKYVMCAKQMSVLRQSAECSLWKKRVWSEYPSKRRGDLCFIGQYLHQRYNGG